MPVILVADIGGTNTRVGLARGIDVDASTVARYRNAEHAGLEEILADYIAGRQFPSPKAACIAVAGPVNDGAAHLTNLDWAIDPVRIAACTGATQVSVINDLQAQGFSLPHLAPDARQVLLPGEPASAAATHLVIGIGTGLNAAPVFTTEAGLMVPPSETGHIDLPVLDEEGLRLSRFLRTRRGLASAEEAVSGRGIEQVYAFVRNDAGEEASDRAAQDIVKAHVSGDDPYATRSLELVARLLGHVASDLALIHLPVGGICLAGGVARSLAPHLEELGFADAFFDKGRFASWMRRIPVSILVDDYAALTGAASAIVQRMPTD